MVKPLKILKASAGAGKTHSLTAHFLVLLFAGETQYRHILAVTFTNKATAEMKTRILEELRELAAGDTARSSFCSLLLDTHPHFQHDPDRLKAAADRIYRHILHDYGHFSVMTIDGFVQKIIRGFAFELGLGTNYGIEMNQEKVKTVLTEKLQKKLDNDPHLVKWIIELAKDRLSNNKGWNYARELNQLSNEIFKDSFRLFEHSVQQLLKKEGNINELFRALEKQSAQRISGFEKELREKAGLGWNMFLQSGVKEEDLKGMSKSPLWKLKGMAENGDIETIPTLEKLIDHPDAWFKKNVSTDLYAELNPVLAALTGYFQQHYGAYMLDKELRKNIYYLRLMLEMTTLLREYREETDSILIGDAQTLLKGINGNRQDNPSFIYEKIGTRFSHYLFDEFQDTSATQWHNFLPLLSDALSNSPEETKYTNHLVVGDIKQSIYRWRNGDWRILQHQIAQDLGSSYMEEDSLQHNYRSTEDIIAFNNFIFGKIPGLLQDTLNKKIQASSDPSLQSWWEEKNFDHLFQQVYDNSTQQLKTESTPAGGTIKVRFLKDEENGEAYNSADFKKASLEIMAEEISELIESGRYKADEIGILTRNKEEALAVINQLMQIEVPVISTDALYLSNNTAVQLLVNTLYLLTSNEGQSSLYKANCISLYSNIIGRENPPEAWRNLEKQPLSALSQWLPAAICEKAESWLMLPLPELIDNIIAAYGLNTKAQSHNLAYILAFQDQTAQFMQQGERGLQFFLEWWEEEGNRATLPALQNSNAAEVLTIHKSKGLAYKAVFIPFCNWKLDGLSNSIFWVPTDNTNYKELGEIPLYYTSKVGKSDAAHAYYEELIYNYLDSLNLLYVANTRAREYLSITGQWKKASTIVNIGEALYPIISGFDKFNKEGNKDVYISDTKITTPDKKQLSEIAESTTTPHSTELQGYPISDRLEVLFDNKLPSEEIKRILTKDASREGSLLHEILARTTTPSGLNKVLQTMLTEGWFKKEEIDKLREKARKVLENPAIEKLFGTGKVVYNERTIIDSNGHLYRPDKVWANEKETILLDYKFTTQKEKEHFRQVAHYKYLLKQLGIQNIRAYLYYAQTDKLEEVTD